MRKLILIAACALAAAALPALAGAVAFHGHETFTESFTLFGPDPCVDKVVTGIATQSGTATFVETPNGGFHVRVDFSGRVDLYEATGWSRDLQPGAFVGTWTYEAQSSDQAPSNFKGAVTGVTSGTLVLADGRVLRRQVSFHLTFDEPRACRRRSSSPTSSARADDACGEISAQIGTRGGTRARNTRRRRECRLGDRTRPERQARLPPLPESAAHDGCALHCQPRRHRRAAAHASGEDGARQRAGLVSRRHEGRVPSIRPGRGTS